jgi:DNA-binding response OmpR family regulator
MMPLVDGLDVCRVLRRECEVPVLMLTARSTEEDLLLGLDLGADDYMTKPYSPRELMARIRTLLRRTRATVAPDDPVLRIGALAVDPVRRTVELDGRQVVCTPGEFEILAAMAAEPERVFTRRQLLALTRGFDRYITERTIDVHILNLRKKIEPSPVDPPICRPCTASATSSWTELVRAEPASWGTREAAVRSPGHASVPKCRCTEACWSGCWPPR